MFGIVLLALVVVVVLFAISAYNRLVSLKNQVANAWKQIDVQLKRRHDLIPNLINSHTLSVRRIGCSSKCQ